MRWKGGRKSQNIEDRRGSGRRRAAGLGGGVTLLVVVGSLLFGVDPSKVLSLLSNTGVGTQQQSAPIQTTAEEEEVKEFLSVVLGDTEQVWDDIFRQAGLGYKMPTLVLYRGQTPTACGTGQAAAGPFYCPGDHKLYLDLAFLSELNRMGARGDFALAYVIAHEVGHHVQALEGTLSKVQQMKRQASKVQGNQLQVRVELQADCYAGVWAYHANKQRQMLEPGDVDEGMAAAAAVGDDTLQRAAGRRVVPEAFTHGSAKQRKEWLNRGLRSGRVADCNTFG